MLVKISRVCIDTSHIISNGGGYRELPPKLPENIMPWADSSILPYFPIQVQGERFFLQNQELKPNYSFVQKLPK